MGPIKSCSAMKDNINFASIHWVSQNWTGCIGQCTRGGKNKYAKLTLTLPLLNVEPRNQENTKNNIWDIHLARYEKLLIWEMKKSIEKHLSYCPPALSSQKSLPPKTPCTESVVKPQSPKPLLGIGCKRYNICCNMYILITLGNKYSHSTLGMLTFVNIKTFFSRRL